MYLEHRWLFSEDQDIDTAPFTNATNIVDLEDIRDVGTGKPLYLHTIVTETFDFGGGATAAAKVQLVGVLSPDTTFSGDVTTVALGPEMFLNNGTDAMLSLGAQFYVPIMLPQVGIERTPYNRTNLFAERMGYRYFGVRYAVAFASGSYVAGKLTTRLSLDQSTQPAIYPASTSS